MYSLACSTDRPVLAPPRRLRSYSSQHLWAAEHFARLAADYEREHAGAGRISIQHRAYVMTAVFEAVAFLEAFINELYQDPADGSGAVDGLPPEMVRLMTEYWRSTDRGHSVEITKKYDMPACSRLSLAQMLVADPTKT